MSLTVRNASRVTFVLNLLPSMKVEQEYAPTKFSMEVPVDAREGQEAGARLVEKTLPASITWLPGETKTGLPEGITEIEEYRRAVTTRKLVLVKTAKEGEAPPPPTRVPGDPKTYEAGAPATPTSNPTGERA